MPRFAKALIAFQHSEQHPELTSLFKAQLVAGLYGDALASLDKLRAPLAADPSPRVRARYLDYLLYARARLTANETKTPFQGAYREAFHALISRLDNKTFALAVNHLAFDNLSQANQALEHDLADLKGKTAISPAESLQLISDYSEREIYRAFGPISAELIAQDDSHRYVIQKDVMVALPDGGSVCALIICPLRQPKLPALLQFTIYDDTVTLLGEARRAASNDYVGVMGLTRGKGCSPGGTVPYEHDGADAAALVDWIAAQPWSDGKVGMYGGSYSGFTPWAAAKHQPKALRSIMVGAPVAPGVDVPMEGNVVWNFIYAWPFYTATNKLLNNGVYFDRADFRSVRLMSRQLGGGSAWSRCSVSSRSRDGKSIMARAGKSSMSQSRMPKRRCKSRGSAAATWICPRTDSASLKYSAWPRRFREAALPATVRCALKEGFV